MVKYYLFLACALILHELGHFIALKLFRVNVHKIVIGNLFHIKLGKIEVSPIIVNCRIDFSLKKYEELKLISRLIIISAGPLANFLLVLVLPKQEEIFRFLSLLVGIGSAMPIPFLNTDGKNFINEILTVLRKSKKKKGNRNAI